MCIFVHLPFMSRMTFIIMPLEACEIIMPLEAGDGFKLNLFVVIVNVPFYLFYYIIDIFNYLLVGETHNMKAYLF